MFGFSHLNSFSNLHSFFIFSNLSFLLNILNCIVLFSYFLNIFKLLKSSKEIYLIILFPPNHSYINFFTSFYSQLYKNVFVFMILVEYIIYMVCRVCWLAFLERLWQVWLRKPLMITPYTKYVIPLP